jgi:O-antigen/teichoic acid export membrane protein
MNILGLFGFLLRGGSAASKFFLVIYLAKNASGVLLGQLALLMTIVAVFVQVAGLEINQVIGRQLHCVTPDERLRLLRRQAQAAIVAYSLFVPSIILVYANLMANYWLSVLGILVLEHFIIEVYRVNILMLRPVYASCILFMKNVGWILLFVALVEANHATPSLSLVLHCWFGVLVFTATPLLLKTQGWQTLREMLTSRDWPAQSIDLVWQARSFIVSAAALASIGAVDKLIIASRFSEDDLGIYYFFATCASVTILITSFGVGSTTGPLCIKVHGERGYHAFLPYLRRLKYFYWLTTVFTSIAIILPADFLLSYIGNAQYQNHVEILYFLTVSVSLVVLCEPYKMQAYLERQHAVLVIGNIFHLLSVIMCVGVFSLKGDIVLVSMGVLISSLMVFAYFSLGIGYIIIGRLGLKF